MTELALHQSHTLGPLYIVVERFDARLGEKWEKFISWSGLAQVQEVVSLDRMLCPTVIEEILDEDWAYIVNENFMLDYFLDLDYLLRRVGSWNTKNLLCVFRNPSAAPALLSSPLQFEFLGYDLVDVTGAASPITNCGGFPDVFANSELNRYGLLSSIQRAREVQQQLFAKYKGESHTETHLWGIARAL